VTLQEKSGLMFMKKWLSAFSTDFLIATNRPGTGGLKPD
jgi:hypothetical protein